MARGPRRLREGGASRQSGSAPPDLGQFPLRRNGNCPRSARSSWVPAVREADALLVWGGDVLYLTHWLRQSGLADLLPSLSETVYVGVSAGSIAVTPYNCDAEFDSQFVPDGSDMAQGADRALGLVDFTLYPHLNHPDKEDTALSTIQNWASGVPVPTYAIDDVPSAEPALHRAI
ncbi:Type 1 glutamine amidotransferase-like domain-containing protein [Micromonospora ureilytica]|uniref:Type 1 glutamine amidotransferase-like domain-containing protein n=1 Tax=Micromonospora ureilytica TaxID=709868 RepID=UPI0023E79F4D|nr:Type 1 glutamine amidotransferase-like domain-containing protein [Micromonospora ureilytica]